MVYLFHLFFSEFSQYLSLLFSFFFFVNTHFSFHEQVSVAGLFGDRMNFKRAGLCHFFEHEQEEVEWPYGSRRTGQIFEQTSGKRSTLLWLVNAARRFKETRFNHLLCDSKFLISFVRENCLREKHVRYFKFLTTIKIIKKKQ